MKTFVDEIAEFVVESLLYRQPVVLHRYASTNLFNLFMLFSTGIRFLASQQCAQEYTDYANEL